MIAPLAWCASALLLAANAPAKVPANKPVSAASGISLTEVAERSQLDFHFKQAGAETSGKFGKFTVRLNLDPKGKPAGLQVAIDVASLATQDAERDGLLRGPALFDAAKYPQARFYAAKLTAKAGGLYEANGLLTIRNVSKPLKLTLRVVSQPNGAPVNLSGEATISRLAFGIGQGEWRSTEWVADSVRVSFKVAFKANSAPSQ